MEVPLYQIRLLAFAPETVSKTESPEQIEVAPALNKFNVGFGFTIIAMADERALQPPPLVTFSV